MPTWTDVAAMGTLLPGVEESTSYATPATFSRARRARPPR